MRAPCAHAAPWPTRTSGQTTGSLVARLGDGPAIWATGTSAPCLSVFKRVGFDTDTGPAPRAGEADRESLFWRHERLHRAVLARPWGEAVATFDAARRALEAEAVGDVRSWDRHRAALDGWAAAAQAIPATGPRLSRWFWSRASRQDGL